MPEDKELHAEDIVINLIQKQDTEINKLNKVIDRMAEYIAPSLKVYKKLQNKNIQVAYGGRRYNTERIVIENYIPKSKVKEKIEEYKRKMEKDVNYLSKDYFNYRHKIYALQELLED